MDAWSLIPYGVIISFSLAGVLNFICFIRCQAPWRIFKLLNAGLSLYWVGVYVYITLVPAELIHNTDFAVHYIRTGIFATGVVLCASAIFRHIVSRRE